MRKLLVAVVFIYVLAVIKSCPVQAFAQSPPTQPGGPTPSEQIGLPCTTYGQTRLSYISTQGVIECIPDTSGNLFWEPMGGGGTRYDSTTTCTTAGQLRWNGTQIQYCDGSQWQNFGGGQTLVVGGCLTAYQACPPGYVATSYFSPGTYNCCDRCGNPSWKYTVCSQ